MRILVTGGPVHTHLDAVKVITNRFRGGRMRELAQDLMATVLGTKVIYLTSNMLPSIAEPFEVRTHSGFESYREQVLELAPTCNAVVLGAAVANLIPKNPWKGKFPSHDYKVGDTIPIDFTVAPRIIDEIKAVAPYTKIFGFKLLSGVPLDELIRAAYEIVLSAKATAVFANDTKDLDTKYAVMKDRSVHRWEARKLAWKILELTADEYFSTVLTDKSYGTSPELDTLIESFQDKFIEVEEGMRFGTVAVRDTQAPNRNSFFTTARGKKELTERSYVVEVMHHTCKVVAAGNKPTLNAPLLSTIFKALPQVHSIVHYHAQELGLVYLPYAPPGTVRDSDRQIEGSFNIEGHGCYLLFDDQGCQI